MWQREESFGDLCAVTLAGICLCRNMSANNKQCGKCIQCHAPNKQTNKHPHTKILKLYHCVSLLMKSYCWQNCGCQALTIWYFLKGSMQQWQECLNNQLSKHAYIHTGSVWANTSSSAESSVLANMKDNCYFSSYISFSLAQEHGI